LYEINEESNEDINCCVNDYKNDYKNDYTNDEENESNFICLKLENSFKKHINYLNYLKEKSNTNYKNAFISYNSNYNFFENSYNIYKV